MSRESVVSHKETPPWERTSGKQKTRDEREQNFSQHFVAKIPFFREEISLLSLLLSWC